jgi:ubiquinone/menaquinone biosynthesis C-methylase UbiE
MAGPPVSGALKYTAAAEGWSETQYARPDRYLERRAAAVRTLGVALEPGDRVLDLACGDGGFAEPLLAHGLHYAGVDANDAMAASARRRLDGKAGVTSGDLNSFRPAERVDATCVFRAIYYAADRPAFFAAAAGSSCST